MNDKEFSMAGATSGPHAFWRALGIARRAAWLVCFLWPGWALALDPGKALSQYNLRTWTRQNGLPVNGINAIAQTRDGYLWFGTALGLVRFDAMEFTLSDLSHVPGIRNTIVTSLASAHDRGLWVGLGHGGFGFHDGHAFSFRNPGSGPQIDLDVSSLSETKDGTLWFATLGGAFRLSREGTYENLTEAFTNTPTVTCSYEDRQGRLWFGTDNQGAFCWEAGKITRLTDPELSPTHISAIAQDQEGQIWLGTPIGLFCYDAQFQRQVIPPLATEIRALLVDQHGVLWLGTSGNGLVRWRQGQFEFLKKPDGLAGNYVNALAEDREGSLWIGTRDGVSQLTDVKFPIHRAAEDPLVRDALAVGASQRGGVWIASPGGVTYFDGMAKTYGTETGLDRSYVKRVLEASNGDLYLVVGSHRLAILSAEKKVAVVYTNRTMVVGMAEDAQGVVVSVGGELYRAGTNNFHPYEFKGGEKPQMNWILNLASGRDGVIWVACNAGIFRVKDGEFRQWVVAQAPAEPIQWVCEDGEGIVWGGTRNGIVRLKGDDVRLIRRKHGLFDDNIYSIVPDDFGQLWVDSGRGVFCVSRRSMNDFAEGRSDRVECTVYDGSESVKTADKTAQEHVGCKSADGRIWFPSPQGVIVIDPARIPTNRIAPPVMIARIRANGVEVARTERLIVAPGKGELEFSFAALSFIAPQKVRFRYRLVGFDPDWVEAGDRRLAFYTNLKPGQYNFQVIAANADGVWNESGDHLSLELRPRFSQTIWFYLLCGGAGVGALAGAVCWRLRRLRREQRVLQENRDRLEAEVRTRTAELARANTSLQHEIGEHKHTTVELRDRTVALEKEIVEHQRSQAEVERIHRQLLETSRQAGMAEVATNVLHNVGNVLNSVNVSSTVVMGKLQNSRMTNLAKVAALLAEHKADLGDFITRDPQGKQLADYLVQLAAHLQGEQTEAVKELGSLRQNIDHIKAIVAMQQNYARVSGVKEITNIHELVEDSLRMNVGALDRHGVKLIREFEDVPPLNVEKHKVLQILVNLVRNAKYACDDSDRADKLLTVRVASDADAVKISVVDNGVGIPPQNLTRIFGHGFTTRKGGHGFGLHSGALAAKEMGGALHVHSDGLGHGAEFTLELPIQAEGGTRYAE